ncbi:MAG: antiterminator LoaP [Spirochaetia bacterium]
MTFFVIQVRSQKISQYFDTARKQLEKIRTRLHWPRRNLRIRKKGKWQEVLSPIFPGYLFLETETVTPDIYNSCRQTPGFIRFLKDNQNITPLSGRDKEIVAHFLNLGGVVGYSLVDFDRNQRVRIISGPLKGLEGHIVKVNRRKKRIKLKLELYKDSFFIDFGFESIEKVKEAEKNNEQ